MTTKIYCDICNQEAKCRMMLFANHWGIAMDISETKQRYWDEVCKNCFEKTLREFDKMIKEKIIK